MRHYTVTKWCTIGVGDGGTGACTPKIREKYFLGGKYVKFGHFVNFSYMFFRQKCLAPTPIVFVLQTEDE